MNGPRGTENLNAQIIEDEKELRRLENCESELLNSTRGRGFTTIKDRLVLREKIESLCDSIRKNTQHP